MHLTNHKLALFGNDFNMPAVKLTNYLLQLQIDMIP